jgi:hypothetical protein
MNKIEQFIEDNKVDITDLESFGSESNSLACILSGYALYLDMSFDDLSEEVNNIFNGALWGSDELERVYIYAEANNYGEWWKSNVAKSTYKF